MNHPHVTSWHIAIKCQRQNGTYIITSDQVPGLVLAGDDSERLARDVLLATRELLRVNRGLRGVVEWLIELDSGDAKDEVDNPFANRSLLFRSDKNSINSRESY